MTRTAPVLLLAVLALAGACGVGAETSAREIDRERVPYGLLDASAAPTTTVRSRTSVPQAGIVVYFVLGERLTSVTRQVTAPASPTKVLVALVDGPEEAEAAFGVRSAIHPATDIEVRRVAADVLEVGLSASFRDSPHVEQLLGLAQIVFTLTEMPGVTGVQFTLAGQPVGVPTPTGALSAGPVGRDAFSAFAPPASAPPRPA